MRIQSSYMTDKKLFFNVYVVLGLHSMCVLHRNEVFSPDFYASLIQIFAHIPGCNSSSDLKRENVSLWRRFTMPIAFLGRTCMIVIWSQPSFRGCWFHGRTSFYLVDLLLGWRLRCSAVNGCYVPVDYLGQSGGVRVVPGVVHHAGESIQKVAQVLVPLQLGRLGWFDDWLWWGRRGHGPVVL